MFVAAWLLFVPSSRVAALLAAVRDRLPGAWGLRFEQVRAALLAFQGQRRVLAKALAYSAGLQAAVVLNGYALARALHVELPVGVFFVLVPIAIFVMMVPISINAIGVRENVWAFLLAALRGAGGDGGGDRLARLRPGPAAGRGGRRRLCPGAARPGAGRSGRRSHRRRAAGGERGPGAGAAAVEDRAMRILLLAPHPFFQQRGTPIAERVLLEVLARSGHEIDVLTYPEGEDPGIPSCRILRIPAPPGIRNIRPGFSVKKLALRRGHARQGPHPGAARAATTSSTRSRSRRSWRSSRAASSASPTSTTWTPSCPPDDRPLSRLCAPPGAASSGSRAGRCAAAWG